MENDHQAGAIETRQKHLIAVLRCIRNVNQLIVAEDDPGRLVECACEMLTEGLGYHNAWIVLLGGDAARALGLPDQDAVSVTASTGFNGGFGAMRERLERGDFTACMARALETGATMVTGDPATDCPDCPLSGDYGGCTGLTRRLDFDGVTYGILAVSAPAGYAKEPEAQELFGELARDLTFGLHRIAAARRLQEISRSYRDLFEKNSAAKLVIDPDDGQIVDANPAAARFYGWSRDDLCRMRISDINTLTPAQVKAEMEKARTLERTHFEFKHRRADGAVRDVAVYSSRVESAGKQLLYSIVHDITDRKQAEEDLRRKREWLGLVVEGARLGTWEWNVQTDETVFNEAWAAMLGYTLEELTPYDYGTWERLVHPEDIGRATDALKRCADEETPDYSCELRMRHKDGHWVWILDRGRVMTRDADGRPLSMFGTHTDITQIKEKEARIALLGNMLDQAPAAITIHDTDGNFLFSNRQNMHLHGYDSEKEFIAINLHDLDVPESEARLAKRFRTIAEEGEARFEVAHYRKDGSTFPLEVLAKRIEWAGHPAVLSIATDITDRKQAKEALLAANQQLRAVEQQLRAYNQQLVASNSALELSEEKYRTLVEGALQGVVIAQDRPVRLRFANAAMESISGYGFDELLSMGPPELAGLIHADDRARFFENFKRRVAGEDVPPVAEYRILRKDGATSWTMCYSSAIDYLGEPATLTTFVDITDRKHAEEARRRAESRFRIAQDMSPDGFTILRPVRDASGRVVDFVWVYENAAVARLNGTDPEEVVGKRLLELFPGHRGTPFLSAYQRVAETGEPATFEEGYSGESMPKQTWFRIVVVPMDGDIAVLAQDITERKQSEEDILAANQQLRATEQQLRASNLQLRESEERFRQVYEHMAIGVARVSLDMNIEQANEAYCQMLGYTEDQLAGMHLRDITQPEVVEENLRRQAELIAGEIDHFRLEKAFIHKDGHVVHGILDACLVRTDQGEPAYCLGSVIDITERKRAEKEMARRTAELAALYAGARSVLAGGDFGTIARSIFDRAREVTGARSGYVALLSESGEENELLFLESGGLTCSVDPSLPMPIRGLREVAYESGEVALDNDFMNSSWVSFMPEGHVALDNVLFAPLPVEGRTVGIIGLANKPGGFDEDDRRIAAAMGQLAAVALQKWRAEQEVRSERDRLQVVMQTAPIAILMADEHERILQVNRAAEALFGTAGDITDEPLRCGDVIACVHRHESPGGCGHGEACTSCEVYRAIRDGLAGVTVDDLETEIHIENNGTSVRRQILLSAAPLRLGNRPGVILAANDITQMRALHANMAQSDRLSSMGMLAAGVAHEINNPLTYVLYNLESLTEDLPKLLDDVRMVQARAAAQYRTPSEEETDDLTQTMNPAMLDDILTRFEGALGGTRRIRDIARGLGTFSRVGRDKLVPVNLMHVIEVAINMSYNEIKYRARLVKEYGRIPTIMASEGRLSQVFLNLLINATHAIDEGDVENNEIRVKTWSEGGAVFAEVRDTGCGIPPENMDKLFEPFFSTKRIGVGSGLGLAISKNIVEGYGGTVSVESEVGEGTVFTVRLPLKEAAPETDAKPSRDPEGASSKGRILIVDDEARVRAALARILRGHDTVQVDSGSEAREILKADDAFDLILCDVMMPDISGMDLHEWLCARDPDLAKRFVFVTGGAFTPRAREYLASVDNLKIEKPFEVDELRATIDGLIANQKKLP